MATIIIDGIQLEAATCDECGTLHWPPEGVERICKPHHERARLALEGLIKLGEDTFGRVIETAGGWPKKAERKPGRRAKQSRWDREIYHGRRKSDPQEKKANIYQIAARGRDQNRRQRALRGPYARQ